MLEIPRGTRDFLPKDMQKRRYVEKSFSNVFKSFGYNEVQTPTFEHLDLFTLKSGESIIDELYSFIDKGGRNLALRPELTAPVIRMYVDKLQMNPKPLKLFYFGNCYRYDRPQKGRYREFTQAGCELIGAKSPEALAELVSMAFTLFRDVGISNIVLNIGNLKLLKILFRKMRISDEQKKYLLPLIDKELTEDIAEALSDFGFSSQEINDFLLLFQDISFDKLIDLFQDENEALEEILRMKEMFDVMRTSFNIHEMTFHMGIVRGLDYYTGMVFEIKAPKLGAEKQICGGGEYELISLFKGRESPTSGFAVGFDRTILAMEMEQISFPKRSLDFFIIPINNDMIKTASNIAMKLRSKGKCVDVDLMRRGTGKAMKYASSIQAKKVIFVGPDELTKNSITVRDMKTGNQEIVELDNLLNEE